MHTKTDAGIEIEIDDKNKIVVGKKCPMYHHNRVTITRPGRSGAVYYLKYSGRLFQSGAGNTTYGDLMEIVTDLAFIQGNSEDIIEAMHNLDSIRS